MLRDDYEHPGSPCTVEEGDTSRGVTQLLPGEDLSPVEILTPGDPSYISGADSKPGYQPGNFRYATSLVDSHFVGGYHRRPLPSSQDSRRAGRCDFAFGEEGYG